MVSQEGTFVDEETPAHLRLCMDRTRPLRLFGRHDIEWAYRGLESPIERTMLRLLMESTPLGITPAFHMATDLAEVDEFVGKPETFRRSPFLVFPQLPVDRFRLDFLLVFGPQALDPADPLFRSFRFALECDGEKFHRDRRDQDFERDRHMRARHGLPTLRVSGAKIVGRPTRVTECLGALFEAVAEAEAERIAWMRERMEEFDLPAEAAARLAYKAPEDLAERCRSALGGLGYWWDDYPIGRMYEI